MPRCSARYVTDTHHLYMDIANRESDGGLSCRSRAVPQFECARTLRQGSRQRLTCEASDTYSTRASTIRVHRPVAEDAARHRSQNRGMATLAETSSPTPQSWRAGAWLQEGDGPVRLRLWDVLPGCVCRGNCGKWMLPCGIFEQTARLRTPSSAQYVGKNMSFRWQLVPLRTHPLTLDDRVDWYATRTVH